jgi:hypothetical protein
MFTMNSVSRTPLLPACSTSKPGRTAIGDLSIRPGRERVGGPRHVEDLVGTLVKELGRALGHQQA